MRNGTFTRWWLAGLMLIIGLRGSLAFAEVSSGVRYTLPTGWTAADKDGVRILAPSDQKGGLMVAMVVGAQAAVGSPDDQIAELAASINTGAKVSSGSQVTITDRGALGKFYMKNFNVETTELGAHGRMIVILVRGDQRAVIVFVFTDNATLQKHGAAMQALLKSIEIAAKPGSPSTPKNPPAAPSPSNEGEGGHLPTGNTPESYFGSVGWMPSGRGVKIPAPRVVKGRPEGMWWRYQADASKMFPLLMAYLPDGTHVYNPRFGSGALIDVEGQRKQHGNTGVGTFSVKDGKITQTADGFTQTDTFKSGTDKDGAWFEIGAGRHYPLELVPAKNLVGTWRSPSGKFIFRADGTFESGTVINDSEMTVAQGLQGRYQADGYLLAVRPAQGAAYITSIGRTGKFLIIGQTVYSRE